MNRLNYPNWFRSLLMAVVPFALVLSSCIGVAGPASSEDGDGVDDSASGAASVRVVVSSDFGHDLMLDATVPLVSGMTALDALQAVATVDTSYGGGFVAGIDGVGSDASGQSARADWFYSVNGLTARTGAADLTIHEGDTVHWDYRGWSFRRNVSATVGAFPAAFARGYRGTVRETTIVYEEPFASDIERLCSVLEDAGASHITVIPLNEVDDDTLARENLLIVAYREAPLVREINDNWDRLGLFARFEGAALVTYGPDGGQTGSYDESAGIVLAMQNPWNPDGTGACENVVVVVTGCDKEGIGAAVDALVLRQRDLSTWVAAAVSDGCLRAVP